MILVGLTGGIGAGKSTVSRMLADLGATVVDADFLARQVVEPGTAALRRIVEEFGPTMTDGQGHLDRARLAERVFSDPRARQRIEAITHPAIEAAFVAEVARLQSLGLRAPKLVVYDAALLVETGRYRKMDLLIVVIADDAARAKRLRRRDGQDEVALRARMAAQLPQRQKAELADFVIDNSGSLADTREQVARTWRQISRRA